MSVPIGWQGFPSSQVRYSVMRHAARVRSYDWLREDGGRVPLVEVDRPFKVARANNNNYGWGQKPTAEPRLSRATHITASQHPSKRSCPWG